MPEQIRTALNQYVRKIKEIYGDALQKVILYGSYARGDFNADSDIDIMILVNASDEEIIEKKLAISDMTYDVNDLHDMEIMPIVKNAEHFFKWVRAYPFYNNVINEGVELYDI